jgi:deoxyadenosine/deoxycytidine kinase
MHIYICGNVCSGKTTVCNELAKCLQGYDCVVEDNIQNYNFINYLSDSDSDAFSIQLLACVNKSDSIVSLADNKDIIYERHLTELLISSKSLYETRNLTKMQYEIIKKFIKLFNKMFIEYKPDLIFYLKCNPKTTRERINRSSKYNTSEFTNQYIATLQKNYDEWFIDTLTHGRSYYINTEGRSPEYIVEKILSIVNKK